MRVMHHSCYGDKCIGVMVYSYFTGCARGKVFLFFFFFWLKKLYRESLMTRRKVETRKAVPMPSLPEDVLERIAHAPKVGKNGQKVVLSPREWTFVHEYVTRDGTMTRTEAAIRAGYTPKAASEVTRRLLDPARSPHVVAAVNELRAELAERYGTTFERHMRDLQMIRDKAIEAGAWSAAVQAEYRRGQALGTIYVDRKEVRIGLIDTMSKEEVMRKLQEIKQIYGGPPPATVLEMEMKELEKEPELVEPEVNFTPEDFLSDVSLAGKGTGVATKKRTEALRQIKTQMDGGSLNPTRDTGQLGNSRLDSGAAELAFRPDRAEGS
jgi:hypothetical protein